MNLKSWFQSRFVGGVGTKDWSYNLPVWTSQFSVPNRLDAMDCLSESIGNVIYMMTGFDSSPRFTAKLSGTTTAGNSQQAVLLSVNRDGLLPYSLWPTPDTFDWFSYYNDIPEEIKTQAVHLKVTTIAPDLNKSPLWTILRFPNGAQHGVAQINQTQYFDSEQGDPVKPLNYGGAVIVSQLSLKVTFNFMDLRNDNGTWYIVGDKGKIGIADPAALAKFQAVTSQFSTGPTNSVSSVGVFKNINIDQTTNVSVLGNN